MTINFLEPHRLQILAENVFVPFQIEAGRTVLLRFFSAKQFSSMASRAITVGHIVAAANSLTSIQFSF